MPYWSYVRISLTRCPILPALCANRLSSANENFDKSLMFKIPKEDQTLEQCFMMSSSSCHAASTDIPDPLSPLLPIILAGLQGYIPYPHIAAECMFKLVVLLLLGHMWGSIMSTSLTSSSLLLQQCPACLVCLTWIVFVM